MADGDGGGIGTIVGAQFIAVALKLLGWLKWPWFWVFVPVWWTLVTVITIVVVGYVVGGIMMGIQIRLRIDKLYREEKTKP